MFPDASMMLRSERFAEFGVGNAEHRAIVDAGNGVQRGFDFGGVDVDAAADDHLLGAAREVEEPVIVQAAEIARLLVEEGGFLYDSDAYNDDLPYWVDVGTTKHLIVPYGQMTNDVKYARGGMVTGEEFFTICREAFDLLLAEGRTQPKMMSVGLHCRLTGHPARASGLARFLDYVARHQDAVWVCRRLDIARHWLEHHPAP